MNRLVIIGNGFDLAHGLPTSYKDFIVDYWINVLKELHDNHLYGDSLFVSNISRIMNNPDAKLDWQKSVYDFETLKYFISRYERYCTLEFTNNFFLNINNQINIENWVDIENEYYKKLKIIVKLSSLSNREKKAQTIILNTEFEQVKNLLEKYLKDKVEEQYDFMFFTGTDINDILLPELSYPFDQKQYLKEFQYKDHEYVKEFLQKSKENFNLITLFLNFNYTKVVEQYFDGFAYQKQINYIHGKLNDSINKVNFGFGDEMDEDYKIIENIDDNEYLRNFKSFQYLQNSNYKNLLDFVESDQKFQVYIMGHSCGLSDRTMLNTIFENPNCISIKVFYHQKQDGTDNYTEIIQNISRHFNKKKLMREKIVNKTLCQPLPQVKLPLK